MKGSLLLLRTMLRASGRGNVYRHTTDGKLRRKIVMGWVGLAVLYAMLVFYSGAMAFGYGSIGFQDVVPGVCALTVSALAFIMTLFRTNGYLFGFREYDLVMSLPFSARTVALSKFLLMYVRLLPWYLSLSLPMLVGYGLYARAGVWVYPVWVVLTLALPIIPMVAASFVGFLIARISAGFRKTNIVQTVLTFAFVLFCFSLRFIIEDVIRDDAVDAVLTQMAEALGGAVAAYPPAAWFTGAVTGENWLGGPLLLLASAALLALVFWIVGGAYRNINSALQSHAAGKRFRMKAQHRRSAEAAIAHKELRRLLGSTNYMVNGAMGEVLAALLGVATLVIGFDKIVAMVTHNAPFDPAILHPAIPFIVYFLIGMMATTACSPSLEGKNFWILQSLPLSMQTVYRGKMLFNMMLTVPFMAFATLCLCLSAHVSAVHTALYLLLGLALCAFSTAWGCVCGVRFRKLDWVNEMEVIKQGTAVALYLLPNMFVVMGLTVLVVVLGRRMDHAVLALLFTAIAGLLALLSYLRVMKLAEKE